MTTSEQIAVVGVGITLLINMSALVWGAAKMSAKVDTVNTTLKDIKTDFDKFLDEQRKLERLVGTHGTAIALLAQATNVKIRNTDIQEGFGFGPQD